MNSKSPNPILRWDLIEKTICDAIEAKTFDRVCTVSDLSEYEVEFLSLYFKDLMCIRYEKGNTCIMPILYRELETVIIPRVEIVKIYKEYIESHKELNRINNIFLESFWDSNPPWTFSIDKEDIKKTNIINSMESKGYTVSILEEDESSCDLEISI